MKIRCKCDWSLSNNFRFESGKYYTVFIEKHIDTGTDIYYVGDMEMPMIKTSLEKYFDTIQLIREEKLKKLLE